MWRIKALSKLKIFDEGFFLLDEIKDSIEHKDKSKFSILFADLMKAKKQYDIEIKLAKRLIEEGLKYETEEEIEKSIESYKKAVELDPRDPLPHYNLGVIYSRLGKTELMHKSYEKALSLKPNYDKVLYNLGCFYGQQKQPEKAIEYYKKALEINPKYGYAIFNMAYEYEGLGKHDEAIAAYEKYSKIEPLDPSAFFNIAWNYKRQKKVKQAIHYYIETIKIDPGYAKAYNNLGVVYEELDDKKKALVFYSKALDLDPQYLLARKNIESIKKQSPELDELEIDEGKLNDIINRQESKNIVATGTKTSYYSDYQHSRPVQKESEIYDYEELLVKGIREMKTGEHINAKEIGNILMIEEKLAKNIVEKLIKAESIPLNVISSEEGSYMRE